MNQNPGNKKGFRPLYLWSIIYVVLTYAYPFLIHLAMNSERDSVDPNAHYVEAESSLGSNVSILLLLIPPVLLIMNIILSIALKKENRKVFLNCARIIKYSLIPFFIIGGCVIALFFLFMFTPVVIMIFIGPFFITVLSVMGWISMAGCAPFVIAYLVKSVKDGVNGKGMAVAMSIMQFFFCLDVIGLIVCAIRERTLPKNADLTYRG